MRVPTSRTIGKSGSRCRRSSVIEGRKDLGNTEPGDGRKFAGHTAMQITGRDSIRRFRDWCRKFIDPKAPDFVEYAELMNTDPWEGLEPI